MNVTETNLNIELLQNKERILSAKNDNNPERKRLLTEIRNQIYDLEASLPQKPLTLQNSIGSPSGSNPRLFNSLGEQLNLIAKAAMPGQQVDNRLYQINNSAGMNETTPSDGGFTLQGDFSTALLASLFEQSTIPGLCNRFQLQGSSIRLPAIDESSRSASRWGGTLGYWIGEGSEITASKPKFRSLELSLKKMACLSYASDELLEDQSVLSNLITQSFADEQSYLLTDAIIRGTGAGMPMGLLNSGALVTVAKQAGQAKETVLWENVVQMWSRLLPRSKKTAVWLINPDIEQQLYSMALSVGTGGVPVFMPSASAADSPYSTLFGRPLIPCESCSTLGTLGDIILADLSGYVLADKASGPRFEQSISVRFIWDEMAFRMIYRVDGSPMLAAPVLPAQGTNTLSHFVALATRA